MFYKYMYLLSIIKMIKKINCISGVLNHLICVLPKQM